LFTLLMQFAQSLGLAFQIQDDILDKIGSLNKLGKVTGSDDKLHKSTYVTLLGLEGAREELEKHCQIAKQCLQQIPHATLLQEVFNFIVERDY
jgi:geranylgeranyl pyrophosphate synthase